MLWEATIALLSLMFLTWGAAVWASYEEGAGRGFASSHTIKTNPPRKKAA